MRKPDILFLVVLLCIGGYFVLRPSPPIGPLPNPGVEKPISPLESARVPEPAPRETARPDNVPSQDMPSQPAARPNAAVPANRTIPANSPPPPASTGRAGDAGLAENPSRFRIAGPKVDNVTIRHRDGQVVYRGTVDLTKSLVRIQNGKRLEFPDDGIVFQNRERHLPARPAGYYHEYVHPTPQLYGPGPQRIVVGDEGEVYYTPDHYRSFKRL